MSLFEKFFNIQPSIIEKTKQRETYQEKYKGHILEQESYSSNSIGISLHTDVVECTDWLIEHMNNSKEGIKLTVEPITEQKLYVTITHEGKRIEHLECIDFRFEDQYSEEYLFITTNTIPKSLYMLYPKDRDNVFVDIVAFGLIHGQRIRIDAKQVKLVSGVNLNNNKPIEIYFAVNDYILDIK